MNRPESAYRRAQLLLDEARDALPTGGAIPEEGGDPIGYAQALAIAGLGEAMLALCDVMREQMHLR